MRQACNDSGRLGHQKTKAAPRWTLVVADQHMESSRWRHAPGGEIILTACLALCDYDNAAWPRTLDLAC